MSARADFSAAVRTTASSARNRSRYVRTARENARVSPVVSPASRTRARRSRKSSASLCRSLPWRAAACSMSLRRRCGVGASGTMLQTSTNCISSRAREEATAGITRWRSVSRILTANPTPSLAWLGSMYTGIHSPSRKRRMALRVVDLSPGSCSRDGSSTDPMTMYLMSLRGIRRGRSESGGVKMGKPAALMARASDAPTSRPPSMRWTVTGTRPARGS